eukprot:1364085-Pyramimonas_sp.AAC.1
MGESLDLAADIVCGRPGKRLHGDKTPELIALFLSMWTEADMIFPDGATYRPLPRFGQRRALSRHADHTGLPDRGHLRHVPNSVANALPPVARGRFLACEVQSAARAARARGGRQGARATR